MRVALDEKRAVRVAEAKARAEGGDPRSSGTGFLVRKKKVREVVRGLGSLALNDADALFRRLAAHADDARKRPIGARLEGNRLLLDAAFLVPVDGARQFRESVKALARELKGDGYLVTLTGPWPPYNFVADAA